MRYHPSFTIAPKDNSQPASWAKRDYTSRARVKITIDRGLAGGIKA